MGVAHASERDG